MKLTRRAMIRDGLLVVSAGMVMPAIFSRGIASARAQALEGSHIAQTANGRTLIVVQMAGGNDGLNTVIPFSDSLYHQVRPTLAIPDAQVLPLDTRLGLHPNLASLKQFWDAGHLAIVEGVGYPGQDQTLSHFKALDIGVQTAQALSSISAPVPTLSSVESYRVYPDPADTDGGNARLQALMKLYTTYPSSSPYA